ncbi:MAG: hypothetical protein ACLPUG_10140 [Acidimicrobiales bacterium]
MPGATSLAKNLEGCSEWFFRAEDENAPPKRRMISQRLSDLSEHVDLEARDTQIQLWNTVERLVDPPWRLSDVDIHAPFEWEAVADVSDDEVLGTFISLRAKDAIAFLLRRDLYRADIRERARSVNLVGELFDRIVARVPSEPGGQ